jgi:release factor glutamine methyltransferase
MEKFLNSKIDLSKKVFQPRIETEFWLKKAISEIKQKIENRKQKIEVLDMFAGSGCIGISILKNLKTSLVDFVDIDKKAIGQMKINLKLNKIPKSRYRIFRSNLFERIRNKKYDFIFANPPYVALKRISEVQPAVLKNEPPLALFAGKDGLDYIKRFLREVKNYLNPKGKFYLEFDPQQKPEIEKILIKQKLIFEFRKDQFKKWRFLTGYKS